MKDICSHENFTNSLCFSSESLFGTCGTSDPTCGLPQEGRLTGFHIFVNVPYYICVWDVSEFRKLAININCLYHCHVVVFEVVKVIDSAKRVCVCVCVM